MMKQFIFAITVSACLCIRGTAESAAPPDAYGPTPTESQLRWHEMEYYGLLCYGLNTYTGQGRGYGDVDPSLLNPSHLDTDQWVKAAKDGGMRGLILVAKHHDGFCLWPSKTTKYTIAASPWKDGKGDILQDLADSCRKFRLKLGVYISPWDRNHAEYGREQYVKDFHEQWREVLEYDNDIFEVWLDRANGGTGWYGGAGGRRTITPDYYQEEKLFRLCKEKQPHTVIFNMTYRTDVVRWIGNERGIVPETHWCRFAFDELLKPDPKARRKELRALGGSGMKDGDVWMPAEADAPYHGGWYWAANRSEKNLKWLRSTYYNTVGRGASLNLGLSPAKDGLLTPSTVANLKKLKTYLDEVFAVNLVDSAAVTADNVRGREDAAFGTAQLKDQDTGTYWATDDGVGKAVLTIEFGKAGTYWATDDGVGKAVLTIEFGKATTFDHLLMQEHIALGQRVHAFSLEVQTAEGKWETATGGTTIGYRKIMTFKPRAATKAKLTLETDAPCLTLATLGLYKGVSPAASKKEKSQEKVGADKAE